MEEKNNLPYNLQDKGLEIGQTVTTKEISIIGKSIFSVNTIREFPLEPEDMIEWALMIKKAIPDVNPIEIEEAIVDMASGKIEYKISEGARSLILAIQKNRGNDWFYDPNK